MKRKKESWINPIIVKFRKYAPRLIFFKGPFWGVYFWRGLYSEGDKRFKIDWGSLIDGSKFTVFPLFHSVFEGNFPSASLRGAYIWRGDLTEGFLRYRFGGLIFGAAYTWRGLFSEFCGNLIMLARVTFHPLFLRINTKSRAKSIIFTTLLKVTNENFSFQLSFVICNVKISKFQVNENSSI